MKECVKCKKSKEYNNFYKNGKYYLSLCKECSKEKYNNNKQHYIKVATSRYQNNKEEILKKQQIYRQISPKPKEWVENNREYLRFKAKEWVKNNPERIKEYNKKQYKENPQFKLKNIFRSRFNDILKKNKIKKETSIINLIGCSIKILKQHLEQQFKPEMKWDNHGKIWEIDHIKPCASFDLTKEEEQKLCFHYLNLQPLFKTTEIANSLGYNEIGNRNKPKQL